jgi:hypothetical protein
MSMGDTLGAMKELYPRTRALAFEETFIDISD